MGFLWQAKPEDVERDLSPAQYLRYLDGVGGLPFQAVLPLRLLKQHLKLLLRHQLNSRRISNNLCATFGGRVP
jgi:hypothetical protein